MNIAKYSAKKKGGEEYRCSEKRNVLQEKEFSSCRAFEKENQEKKSKERMVMDCGTLLPAGDFRLLNGTGRTVQGKGGGFIVRPAVVDVEAEVHTTAVGRDERVPARIAYGDGSAGLGVTPAPQVRYL